MYSIVHATASCLPRISWEREAVLFLPFLKQEQVPSTIWAWERFGTHIIQPPICAQCKQIVELPLQHLSSLKITSNEHPPSMATASSTTPQPSPENDGEKAHAPSECSAWKGRVELVGLVESHRSCVPCQPPSSQISPGSTPLPACSAWGFATREPDCCGQSFHQGPGVLHAPRSQRGCLHTRGARWTGSNE